MNKKQPKTHIETARIIIQVPLDQIDEPAIPARSKPSDANIEELATSIKLHGMLQPISLNKKGKRYEIVFGHRRFLAHKRLGRAQIHAEIHNWPKADVLIARALENRDREDIRPWDEAIYISTCKKELNITSTALAKKIGVSEAYISQRLKIFSYEVVLQDALKNGHIIFSVARELSRIDDPATLAHYLMSGIENGVTPAVAKRWADDYSRNRDARLSYTADEIEIPSYEAAVANAIDCYFCGETTPYSHAKNIWVCRSDLAIAVDLIVKAASKQSDE